MPSSRRNVSVLRSLLPLLAAAVTLVAVPAQAQVQNEQGGANAQEPAGPQKVNGTIGEVKRKGKAVTLVILSEAGGDPISLPLTPRVPFAIEAKGDLGFLQERQVVSGTGTLTGGNLFVKNWTVHVGLSAKKMRPSLTKSAKAIGQSVNSYDVVGQVKTRQQDKDYPEYETLALNVAQLQGKPVYIDKGATVTVQMSETDKVEEGLKVEMYQQLDARGRAQIVALKVLLADDLKSEEFFAEDDKKSSR